MDGAATKVRHMVQSGEPLSAIVERLRNEPMFVLTPFNFMMVLREASGVPLPVLQRLLDGFDSEMRPLSAVVELDLAADTLLKPYRTS